jgi:hypothetical protein
LESTIIGEFDTRRDAELAVEHVVQDCGVARSDVFVQPVGGANTSGTRPAGADAKAAPTPEAHQKLDGLLEVSVYANTKRAGQRRMGKVYEGQSLDYAAAFNVSNRLRRNASTMISSAVSWAYCCLNFRAIFASIILTRSPAT